MELPNEFPCGSRGLRDDADDYKLSAQSAESLKVVNDRDECAMVLVQENSRLVTRDEMQLQFLPQVVDGHCRMYPGSRK
jgi:hypothetical protein